MQTSSIVKAKATAINVIDKCRGIFLSRTVYVNLMCPELYKLFLFVYNFSKNIVSTLAVKKNTSHYCSKEYVYNYIYKYYLVVAIGRPWA